MVVFVWYTHAQPPMASLGTGRTASERVVSLASHARNGGSMAFADDIVCALLPVGRQIAVSEVVAGHALVASDPSTFENREEEVRKPFHVDLVGS